ncbi:membrane protein [Luteitalea sp. TBR-22]|uniref:sulfite exporter TauE/SafE family protein n=1 Tax=Luteitalea sp. TBR-22 TaxID=2802971 RepID=UPI001AFBA9C8|nr:sulfite exporter TauE/SafE family protein [Luteitalea sp. TBR-22]BCS34420.1 membrane protein [Luteitalea sp. TBR-22]
MTALLAGLAFGLVGSGHCAAMCGPLVLLATPKGQGLGAHAHVSTPRLATHATLYHLGRLCTYLVLGAAAGLAGSALAQLGLGRALAILAGVALLLQGLAATRVVSARLGTHRLAAGVTGALGRAGAWMRTHQVSGPLLFGALNGLLPCGLLYAALTAAAGFGHFGQALLFMGAFAVGTTPVLAALGIAGGAFTARVPRVMRSAAPVALALVGVLLIMRGVSAPHGAHAPAAATDTAVHAHHH